jgi:glycosyltransferase involved in cell wall biosynthesis
MKLLYVVPDTEREGGVSRSVKRITEQMRLIGHDLAVFCPDPETQNGNKRKAGLNITAMLDGTQMMEWTKRTIDEINRWQPDLVVGYYGSSAAYCAVAAAKVCDVKVVACMRGNDINRDFFSSINAHKLIFTIQHADAVTCVSTEMKKKIRAWFGRDAVYISNSVDKNVFYPDPTHVELLRKEWGLNEKPVVALLGEFKQSRGLLLLNELQEVLEPAQLLIIGEIRNEMKHLIPSWVKTVPYIRDIEMLRTAYSVCDIVLQPSLYEGMPNVVLEAMACERIVIASDAGGIKDLIKNEKNGLICNSIDEWKSGIKKQLETTGSYLGREARLSVPSPADEANQFNNLFHEVITNNQLLKVDIK